MKEMLSFTEVCFFRTSVSCMFAQKVKSKVCMCYQNWNYSHRVTTDTECASHPLGHFLNLHKRYVQNRLICCLWSLLIPYWYASHLIFSYNPFWVSLSCLSLSCLVFLALFWLLLGLVHAHLTHNMLSGTVFRVTFKSLKMLSAFKYGNSPGQSNQ